jgi:predicted transposase/invertase (TIGR01784 family)
MPDSDNSITHAHDHFFRNSMSNPKVSREFFESWLPQEILAKVDLSSLKQEKESFIDNELRQNITDILFSVKYGEDKGYFYLMVEQQTKQDYWMPFRLAKYMLNIYDSHLRNNPKDRHLPFVYPLIFFTGTGNYNAPLDLWSLFRDPEFAKSIFMGPYRLIELQKIDDQELQSKLWSGVMSYVMKQVWSEEILPFIKAIKPLLEEIALENNDYIKSILIYIINKGESKEFDQVVEIFKQAVPEEKRSDIMTIADRLIEKGVQQGLQQGIHQGLQQGIHQGLHQGLEQGLHQGLQRTAINMLHEGQPIDLIVRVTGLTAEEVKKLQPQTH